ncbi:hypothetical protein FFLO_04358 [Filobasidium floriforme]|uniref:Metallo-beta-lactamase domain-containing protein n=1 Tax=Filobasidium floriforme TaxID=5210 RepID=A0A8K0JIZ5_9TREE|nr:hypothetical protein FFLO_04358 [Filobasidium floriforme]
MSQMVTVTKENDGSLDSGRKSRPSHWANDQGTKFANPWPSFRDVGLTDVASMIYQVQAKAPSGAELVASAKQHIPIMTPTFGADMKSDDECHVKVTFLGHACFLLEYPSEEPGKRGVRVLLDPVFSERCSPSKWVGPLRYTKAPCTVQELPEIDAVVISHNRKPYLDVATLADLLENNKQAPHLFLPLNTKRSLSATLQQAYKIHELDWWDSRRMDVDGIGSIKVTCTPAQHFSGRGLFDRNASLWASWAIEGLHRDTGESRMKCYFGGDTGYCAVEDDKSHDLDESRPYCPAFKEIGDRFNGFDVAIIPIGAYDPRAFMSPVHCAPIDSVRVFQDIKARKAIGAHWGAWRLTSEPVDEPPKRLAGALKLLNIPADAFGVMAIGETRLYERQDEIDAKSRQ